MNSPWVARLRFVVLVVLVGLGAAAHGISWLGAPWAPLLSAGFLAGFGWLDLTTANRARLQSHRSDAVWLVGVTFATSLLQPLLRRESEVSGAFLGVAAGVWVWARRRPGSWIWGFLPAIQVVACGTALLGSTLSLHLLGRTEYGLNDRLGWALASSLGATVLPALLALTATRGIVPGRVATEDEEPARPADLHEERTLVTVVVPLIGLMAALIALALWVLPRGGPDGGDMDQLAILTAGVGGVMIVWAGRRTRWNVPLTIAFFATSMFSSFALTNGASLSGLVQGSSLAILAVGRLASLASVGSWRARVRAVAIETRDVVYRAGVGSILLLLAFALLRRLALHSSEFLRTGVEVYFHFACAFVLLGALWTWPTVTRAFGVFAMLVTLNIVSLALRVGHMAFAQARQRILDDFELSLPIALAFTSAIAVVARPAVETVVRLAVPVIRPGELGIWPQIKIAVSGLALVLVAPVVKAVVGAVKLIPPIVQDGIGSAKDLADSGREDPDHDASVAVIDIPAGATVAGGRVLQPGPIQLEPTDLRISDTGSLDRQDLFGFARTGLGVNRDGYFVRVRPDGSLETTRLHDGASLWDSNRGATGMTTAERLEGAVLRSRVRLSREGLDVG